MRAMPKRRCCSASRVAHRTETQTSLTIANFWMRRNRTGSGSWDGFFEPRIGHPAGTLIIQLRCALDLVTVGTQNTVLGDLFLYNAAISYRLHRSRRSGAHVPWRSPGGMRSSDDTVTAHMRSARRRVMDRPSTWCWSSTMSRTASKESDDRHGRELGGHYDLRLAGHAFCHRAVRRASSLSDCRRERLERHSQVEPEVARVGPGRASLEV